MGIENIMKHIRTTNGGIRMFSTEVVEVSISVVTGIVTGIFVALLFEFKSWLKNRLARNAQIAYIRRFFQEQKELIVGPTDEVDMNLPKAEVEFVIFEATLRQTKIIVETRSPNLTNEQRSEILGSISGISILMAVLKANPIPPESGFSLKKLQELEDIKWLRVN